MIFNVGAGGGASTADKVKYDNTESGLQSTNVQGAVDELNSSLNNIEFGKIKATGSSITISFEKEFSEIPIVIATCLASGADRTVTVSNITKSECTFYAWMNGDAVSGSIINWIAIGK